MLLLRFKGFLCYYHSFLTSWWNPVKNIWKNLNCFHMWNRVRTVCGVPFHTCSVQQEMSVSDWFTLTENSPFGVGEGCRRQDNVRTISGYQRMCDMGFRYMGAMVKIFFYCSFHTAGGQYKSQMIQLTPARKTLLSGCIFTWKRSTQRRFTVDFLYRHSSPCEVTASLQCHISHREA